MTSRTSFFATPPADFGRKELPGSTCTAFARYAQNTEFIVEPLLGAWLASFADVQELVCGQIFEVVDGLGGAAPVDG